MSIALMGVGTSDRLKIFLAPDLVEYRAYFEGSPHIIGTCNMMETLISSLEGLTPGTIYACLPLIKLLILFMVLGL